MTSWFACVLFFYIYVPGPGTDSPPPMVSTLQKKYLGRTSLRPSFLSPSFFFPSFLSPFLPFVLSSFPPSFEAISAAHHHPHRGRRCFATLLQSSKLHFFHSTLIASTHSSQLYICSYNPCRALVIDNHHTTNHTTGRGDHDHWWGGEGLRSWNIIYTVYFVCIILYIYILFFLWKKSNCLWCLMFPGRRFLVCADNRLKGAPGFNSGYPMSWKTYEKPMKILWKPVKNLCKSD